MGRITTSCVVLFGLTAASCGGGGSSGTQNPGGGDGDVFSLLVDTLGVTATFPANGAVQVPLDTSITVEFDAVLAQECLAEPDTWLKVDGSGSSLAGTFEIAGSGRSFKFTPTAPLVVETDYVFQLSALTCDVDGKLLEEEFTFGFRTIDTTPPTVVSADVAEGASGVSRTQTITIDFSEDLGPTSVTPATLYLRDTFGTDYATTTTVTNHQIVVDPAIDLPGNRNFVLVARGGGSRV